MSWLCAQAAMCGRQHVARNIPCQDACGVISDGDTWCAALADGAGGAAAAAHGARVAVDAALEQLPVLGRPADSAAWGAALVSHVRMRLLDSVAEHGLAEHDVRCTLLAAVAWDADAVILQVGDGHAVWRGGGDYQLAAHPARGGYINETRFVIDTDAIDHLRIARLGCPPGMIALSSDGLEPKAFEPDGNTPRQDVYAGYETWLRMQDEDVDHNRLLSNRLSVDGLPLDDASLVIGVRL